MQVFRLNRYLTFTESIQAVITNKQSMKKENTAKSTQFWWKKTESGRR